MSDIFISYAHVDNQPLGGDEKGWITHFVSNLRNLVTRKRGRAELCDLWMDYRLPGATGVTPEIETQLRAAHTLILFLSPAWLASDWCRAELALFSKHHAAYAGRIFVVEIDTIDKATQAPANLRDLKGYRFWETSDQDKVRQLGWPLPLPSQASHTAYFDRLTDLANEVAQTLAQKQAIADIKATVYIAPVGDGLYEQRTSLINELAQFGIDALPRSNKQDDNMTANLALCTHFVQVLDADWLMGIPCQQHADAETAGKAILQWRDPKLDFSAPKCNIEQRRLLESKHVAALPLPDFCRIVREKVLPKPKEAEPEPPPHASQPGRMVFVHAGPADFDRARAVAQQLQAKGFGISLPRYQGDAAAIRKSIERGYRHCNVLLVMQQSTTADLIEEYLSEALTHSRQREATLRIMICQGEEAEELFFCPPDALLICRDQFEPQCLEQFLAEMAL